MKIEEAKLALIKETIENKLHISDYLRSGDDDIAKFHRGWCNLAYEVLEIIDVTEEEIESEM